MLSWSKQDTQPSAEPLTAHLDRLNYAIEQQSEHIRTLVDLAGKERKYCEASQFTVAKQQPPADLSPLQKHLQQIFHAAKEGNKRTRDPQAFDLTPLKQYLNTLREQAEQSAAHPKQVHSCHRSGQ